MSQSWQTRGGLHIATFFSTGRGNGGGVVWSVEPANFAAMVRTGQVRKMYGECGQDESAREFLALALARPTHLLSFTLFEPDWAGRLGAGEDMPDRPMMQEEVKKAFAGLI